LFLDDHSALMLRQQPWFSEVAAARPVFARSGDFSIDFPEETDDDDDRTTPS
jgi:hypothetical protein